MADNPYGDNFLAGDQYDPYGQTQPPPSAPTPSTAPQNQPSAAGVGAPGNATNEIQGWYSQFLGRNASDAEIQNQLGNPGGLGAVQNLIANSPEAMLYAQKNQQGPYAPPTPGNQPAPAPAAGGTTSSSSINFQPLPRDPRNDQLFNLLMGRAQQSENVDPNDPIIKGQTDAYAANNQRAQRSYLSQAAEQGGPNNNLEGVGRSLAEKGAQDTSGFQATLMGNELTARRNEISQALQESGSLLTADQQMQLQQQLGLIDAQLKQQGLNSQNDQFLASLGLTAQNQNNYWDALRSGLIQG